MKYTSRAQLLRDAADSIEMQEKAGIEPFYKIGEYIQDVSLNKSSLHFGFDYEFPLAVVEGKPVFVGDKLYDNQGVLKTMYATDDREWIANTTSWNPPNPKTVMVELLVEDAKNLQEYGITWRISESCRKALEELK